GAYLPLDPAYPPDRLAFMLADAHVTVLLTTNDHRQGSGVRGQTLESVKLKTQNSKLKTPVVVNLGADWPQIARQPSTSPSGGVYPDYAAYVIYTSGSTGRPKGALNTHRAIANRLLWMQDAYRLTAEDRVMQKTSFSFDVCVWEF